MIGAAVRTTLSAATLARSSTSASSTSVSMSRTSHSSSIQSCRFTDPISRPGRRSGPRDLSRVTPSKVGPGVDVSRPPPRGPATSARSSAGQSRRIAAPSARSGRTASSAAGVTASARWRVRPPSTRTAPSRPCAAAASSRATVAAVTAACRRPAPRPGGVRRRSASRPAYAAATGPPYAGSSRVNAPGRRCGRSSPTTTTVRAPATARRARSSRVAPGHVEGGLVGAAEPRGPTAGQHHGVEVHPGVSPCRPARRAHRVAHWGHAGDPGAGGVDARPGGQPGRLGGADAGRQRPRGVPRGVRPRLRRARLRPRRRTPSRSTARSPPRSPGWPPSAARRCVAGMFERGDDPARPVNTLVLRGAAEADYRKIHLYDSFGYRESDRIAAGPLDAGHRSTSAGFRLGLMTCYDLRFPELARALVDAGAEVLVVPAAWVAGPRKVDHWTTLAPGARDREHGVRRRRRPARPALHRALAGGRPVGRGAGRGRRGRRDADGRRSTRRGPRRGPPHQPVPRQPPSLRAGYPSRPCRPPPPAAAPSARPAARGCAVPVAGSGWVRGLLLLLVGIGCLALGATPDAPAWVGEAGGVLVAVMFTAGLVARTGGRTCVYGALALALGAAVVVTDEPMLRTGAAVLTCVVTAVFAVMATVPAVTTLQAVREVLVAHAASPWSGRPPSSGSSRRSACRGSRTRRSGRRSRWPSWWCSGSVPGCTDSAGGAWWSCSSAAWCWR